MVTAVSRAIISVFLSLTGGSASFVCLLAVWGSWAVSLTWHCWTCSRAIWLSQLRVGDISCYSFFLLSALVQGERGGDWLSRPLRKQEVWIMKGGGQRGGFIGPFGGGFSDGV
jgi:hypothetical protein